MKTITRSKIYLSMTALILTAALALPAAAQHLVPCGPGVAPVCFNGTFQGSDDTSHEPTLIQSMTGIGTHVGQFSSTTTLTVTASGGTGSAQWVAANGDTIATAVVGTPEGLSTPPCQVVGAQPGDHFLKITETHIITGGTGRFAGVQGSFIVTLYHDREYTWDYARDLRLVQRDHYSSGCGSLSAANTHAEKRCRAEVSDSVSPSAGEPAVAQRQARPGGRQSFRAEGRLGTRAPMVLEPSGREVAGSDTGPNGLRGSIPGALP